MTRQAVGQVTSLSWREIVEGGYVIAGSPDSVVEQMKEMITGLHVGNIFCLLHIGDMPKEKCMRSTKLFAQEVMPKLRDMWPEHADDDRFWIHPIDAHAPRPGVEAVGG